MVALRAAADRRHMCDDEIDEYCIANVDIARYRL